MTRDHWFEALADHMGSAYLRYSFTKGTVQEIDHLVDALGLAPGSRVLDVGCGPGRHSHELARRGIEAHGVDISATFVDLARADAPARATFERLDARDLLATTRLHGAFDAVVCLCQGAFGLMTAADGRTDRDGRAVDGDSLVVAGMAAALRRGGRLALSAFSSHFVVRARALGLYDADFDAATGVTHERTEVRSPDGTPLAADLWTACYTPRELALLCRLHGLRVDSISSVEPGAYGRERPGVESPEYLLLATALDGGTARM
ncbi:MAG: SAM-dependent methyltransferase [Ilumatobacteraceae bacterium]